MHVVMKRAGVQHCSWNLLNWEWKTQFRFFPLNLSPILESFLFIIRKSLIMLVCLYLQICLLHLSACQDTFLCLHRLPRCRILTGTCCPFSQTLCITLYPPDQTSSFAFQLFFLCFATMNISLEAMWVGKTDSSQLDISCCLCQKSRVPQGI